ncbi:MAG: RNA-splicing ligase RtcB [Rickettsiales bacterium]|nr:MAG: RNA-splicing ligase RtcB [Rickettsiales bacterium]
MEIEGKFATAKSLSSNLEDSCITKLQSLCNQESFKDTNIRIMPDAHDGKSCCIGFTCHTKGKIIPNTIGVDISCSISTYKIDAKEVDFNILDNVIRERIPLGMNIRETKSNLVSNDFCDEIYEVLKDIKKTSEKKVVNRAYNSIGTLGGGNHFIELNKDSNNNYWLTIHTGSRNFGHIICDYHQEIANKRCNAITNLKEIPPQERQQYINNHPKLDKDLCYLQDDDLKLYIKHIKVAQKFAELSHKVILDEIIKGMNWSVEDKIFTNHNYIEELSDGSYMIRKGSISAKEGQRVIIPINMRDGSIIGTGKGNPEWNYSAPHGAGRLMSRKAAKEKFEIEQFKDLMKDVYSTSINESTIDENPLCYKPLEEIIKYTEDLINIDDIIKSVYNIKSEGD